MICGSRDAVVAVGWCRNVSRARSALVTAACGILSSRYAFRLFGRASKSTRESASGLRSTEVQQEHTGIPSPLSLRDVDQGGDHVGRVSEVSRRLAVSLLSSIRSTRVECVASHWTTSTGGAVPRNTAVLTAGRRIILPCAFSSALALLFFDHYAPQELNSDARQCHLRRGFPCTGRLRPSSRRAVVPRDQPRLPLSVAHRPGARG